MLELAEAEENSDAEDAAAALTGVGGLEIHGPVFDLLVHAETMLRTWTAGSGGSQALLQWLEDVAAADGDEEAPSPANDVASPTTSSPPSANKGMLSNIAQTECQIHALLVARLMLVPAACGATDASPSAATTAPTADMTQGAVACTASAAMHALRAIIDRLPRLIFDVLPMLLYTLRQPIASSALHAVLDGLGGLAADRLAVGPVSNVLESLAGSPTLQAQSMLLLARLTVDHSRVFPTLHVLLVNQRRLFAWTDETRLARAQAILHVSVFVCVWLWVLCCVVWARSLN